MDQDQKQNIELAKSLRVKISQTIEEVKMLPKNRSTSLALTKLDEAKMWLGRSLGEFGQELPAEYRDNA